MMPMLVCMVQMVLGGKSIQLILDRIMWLFKGQKKELDPEKTYLRVEFMTPEEKTFKQQALKLLHKKYQGDEESIIPYETAFPVSFRLVLNTVEISGTAEPIKGKMLIKELLCHLQVTKNEELEAFMHTRVKDIQVFIMNEEMLSRNEVVPLFSEVEATIYSPPQVLEVIYQPRSIWERLKRSAKAAVKDIPKTLLGVAKRIFLFLLGLLGLEGTAKSVVMRMVPTRAILQYLLSLMAVFFPMLGPLIAMGGKMIIG